MINSELLPLLSPRYWHWWGIIGILWLFTRLPYRWQLILGRKFGDAFYYLAPRRRRIAEINLTLCFPELNDSQRTWLLRRHFHSLGMGFLEMLSAWWVTDSLLKPLGHLEGLEHLQTALARGKGVILFSAHFTSFEIGTRFLTMHTLTHATYRPHENRVIEFFVKKSRESRAEKAIARDDVRQMLRSLKNNKPLWFAIDQNYGHKNSVFVNFFGIPAATNTATARLAKISGAAVVPFFAQRLEQGQGYKVIIKPALDNFPSGDEKQDAQRINQLIEEQVRCAPEQYFWVHRRFKDRPDNQERFY